MTTEQEVANLVQDESEAPDQVEQALARVVSSLRNADDSLLSICQEAESATSKSALQDTCRRLNRICRRVLESAPGAAFDARVLGAVSSLPLTERWETHMKAAISLREAARLYKSTLCQELAARLHRDEEKCRLDDAEDEEMFALYLPKKTQVAPTPLVEPASSQQLAPTPLVEGPASKKRGSSALALGARIPKKSKVPALASLASVGGFNSDGSPSKRVIVTREKLRAGLHDHRGLLDLSGSSTNALERTKKLELLKSSGLLLDYKSSKFSDKINAAITRLELGLGGHSVTDSLLFGAKVLSIPGFLSTKNISDIENNNVDGDAT